MGVILKNSLQHATDELTIMAFKFGSSLKNNNVWKHIQRPYEITELSLEFPVFPITTKGTGRSDQ